jgi:dUTP pyrophosphatase
MPIIVVKLVILVNLSNETFVIQNGERIAQLIIAKHERADWIAGII